MRQTSLVSRGAPRQTGGVISRTQYLVGAASNNAQQMLVVIDLGGFPGKNDLPPFEHVYAVSVVGDVVDIGCGQEDGPPGLGDGMQALTKGGDNGRREPFKRFIKEQALWIQGERPSNG